MKSIFDRDIWQEIFGSISQNKLRTLITIIGVLWGIFLYILLSGIAKGVDNGFEERFERISSNSLFVWTQNTSIPYGGFKIDRSWNIKLKDVESLKKEIPEIQYIAPRIQKGNFGSQGANVINGNRSGTYNIYGDFPILKVVSQKDIYDGGRFINELDIKQQRKVCVIGERTQKELFNDDVNPIGKYININSIYFKVIGIHKFIDEGGGSFANDGDIHVPFSTFKRLYNTGDVVGFLLIAGYENIDILKVEEKVKKQLKKIHRLHPEDNRAIGAFNLGALFTRIKNFANGMSFISLIIGVATILAGVIGIGNILLISVKERTKEIGIRRAIGASPNHIRKQIILESVFLTLIAGIIGIILGAFILYLINTATQNLEDIPFTNATVPLNYIFVALLMMVGLGTLIGFIPAEQAISIKPIDALRDE
ncbi:MAG: multidrug ABC transporter ATP-binding protein [Flavobacteriales bacterium]|nr:multidrug ABC transporter ATP-binding protein [Flavobacteriales bacterium]|tara:strand:+ start:2761 stop:4032 length:1272 start_codon:yes stop_codon:yes gene_type:complete